MEIRTFFDGRLVVKTGDITEENAGAVVNAANSTLMGGGGVDGAIHQRGGPDILRECERIRRENYPKGLPAGEAIITNGGDLPAKYVIHTVGPIYGQHEGLEAELLGNCYMNSIKLAIENEILSIAFPSISTGAFGYPRHEAARIVGKTLMGVFANYDTPNQIVLVFFSESDAKMFLKHADL